MNDISAQPEQFDLSSMDVSAEKRTVLLHLFPEVRTEDGKIDFDRLKFALGETVDSGKERYGLTWPGKAGCFKTIQAPSLGTLRPAVEESVNWDTTENIFIEGDSLEVLKLLQKPYLGKIKMIYLDPPYNTGTDFIYPDNYGETLHTYLQYTGQIDTEGRKFGTNTDADGRFHSKWLNMIYPRLYLARNLLTDDGVIFISISDHEVASLRQLMNDVFGEECFSAQLVWKSRKFPDSRANTGVSTDHEYILVYNRYDTGALRGVERDETKFANPDGDPRGEWMSRSILGLATRAQRPNLHYRITDPDTGISYDPPEDSGWRYSVEKMQTIIKGKCILFPAKADGRPREKKFRKDLQSEYVAFPSIIDDVHTGDGTGEIRSIFGAEIFDFPKPTALLQRLVEQGSDKNGIILDFFAGSGTLASAVLKQNALDGGSRKFIVVQIPEPTGRSDFPTIAKIAEERIRRDIKALNGKATESLNLGSSGSADRGFRIFKLAESNFQGWEAQESTGAKALNEQLRMHIDHIRPGRTDDDILSELLIKSGFPLATQVETIVLGGKKVYSIGSGVFLICLDRQLTLEAIRAMAELKPSRVVCLDVGFIGNDQLKVNAVQTFKTKGVAKFQTV
jgi:adenine-specific DNA-methyltransferase